MNDEHVVDEIVTKFLLNTCRLRPRFSEYAVCAAILCGRVATVHPADDDKADCIPLTTGSVAEFYIEPMLPHIGDVDVMFYCSTMLAIPRRHPPPTQLPAEFHNYIKVGEIIDSHLPGYVYLHLRYLLTKDADDGKYNAVEYDEQKCLSNQLHPGATSSIHGPAILQVFSRTLLSLDAVPCVRCLAWPSQAVNWKTRHRNYGWPDSATVDRVVGNGCDVVHVAHRQCKQHEWMGKHQHRLSFSRAEIVLINSWMPVQQIVYHMLRVFMKNERMTDSADNSGAGTLSNYHIKTLMLWACELKSRSWWTDDLYFVKICAKLLIILGDWLNDARCQHYFINNCNLIDSSFNVGTIGGRLISIDATWLSKWFVNNYIRKCSHLCPEHISRLFDDVTTTMKLHDAVSAVVGWRLNNAQFDVWKAFEVAAHTIAAIVNVDSLSARSCACWMIELENIDSCLTLYFTAVAFLHVAYKSSRYGLNADMMDVLAILVGEDARRRRYSHGITSTLLLDTAANLMKAIANKSLSTQTLSLIAIELSKAYLHRALSCEDSDSDSIYCLANVYLAVLYYTTRQYQTAIDHCTLVMRSQDHSQCSSHVVQGELLPKIDDDVDNMLGLAVLYQYIQVAAFNHQCPTQHVSVLTTELFAYYLRMKCFVLSACQYFMQTSSTDELKLYEIHISDTIQPFVGDVLLFMSLNRFSKQKLHHTPVWMQHCQPMVNPAEHKASDLVELLQQSAVEHITTLRQIDAPDSGSVTTIVTTDFEALYAYKRGDYQRCLQLSTQNVHTLLYADRLTDVPTLQEFIQLLDDDLVSITALALIVNSKYRTQLMGDCAFITQLTLSLYMMAHCQLKLRHSVVSLARTLCYIEVAQRIHSLDCTLDHLTLKLTERKVVLYVEHWSKPFYV